MSNVKYQSLISAKLLNLGFPRSEIDALTAETIRICDSKHINALDFLENDVRGNESELMRYISRQLESLSSGTSFTTTRHDSVRAHKVIRRQIIDR